MDKDKKADDKLRVIDNLTIQKDNISISVNPKIYPLDVIYSAAYVLMDRAYFVIDGEPEEEILVTVRPKNADDDLEAIGRDFNNELINYAVYKAEFEKNRTIRESIVKRALYTNTEEEPPEDEYLKENEECEETDEEPEEDTDDDSDESYIDDPEGIAVPWEEKYGKKKSKENE